MNHFLKQLFSLILPITVLVIVPLSIENRWKISPNFFSVTGLLFLTVGLTLLSSTILMFIRMGKGTLAPWNPTKKLVQSGVYAYTRNPMITGVFSILIGELLIFRSNSILIWAVLFFIINHIYFVLSEEPGLTKRFGQEYNEYKKNVPRWIPRLTPWKPAVSKQK